MLPHLHSFPRYLSVSLACLAISFWLPVAAWANGLVITATAPARPDQFQLQLTGPAANAQFQQDTILTYHVMFGTYLSRPIDMLVITASWSPGTITATDQSIDILSFVSASPVLGAQPQVNLAQRTIAWTIRPMPPGTGNDASFSLKLNGAYTGTSTVTYQVQTQLTGPGMQLGTNPLEGSYLYQAPVVTPTPSSTAATSPTPTPSSTPSPTSTPSPIQGTPAATLTPLPTTQPTPRPTPAPAAGFMWPTLSTILKYLPSLPTQLPSLPSPQQAAQDVQHAAEVTQKTAQKVAEHGGAIVATPGILVGIGTFISLVGQVIPYFSPWQLPGILTAWLFRPKRQTWGVVYDSVTHQPLDPVILSLTDQSGRTYQTISDIYGRYQFLVGPGTYTLTAQKTNYAFPSTRTQGKPDPVYDDRYYGQSIDITDAGSITLNVPMDPVATDWNEQEKHNMGMGAFLHHWPSWQKWIYAAGLIWSFIMVALSPNAVNLGVVGIYLCSVVIVWLYRSRHPWGVITDPANHPIPGAVVTVQNLAHPQVKRPPLVTDDTGRYAFLVDGGDYQVNVSLPESPGQYAEPMPGPKLHVPGQYGAIHQDLVVGK